VSEALGDVRQIMQTRQDKERQRGDLLPPEPSLRKKLDVAVDQALVADHEAAWMFDGADDQHWAETQRGDDSPTGKSRIYLNEAKFEAAGASGHREQMLLGEGLHLLKDVDPPRFQHLLETAKSEPEVMHWFQESYKRETAAGEKRPFDKWLEHSRFDQVVGGYMFGGKDSPIPTMRNWDKGKLPFGTKFRAELDKLERDLELKK
jgi:hypothetical protein